MSIILYKGKYTGDSGLEWEKGVVMAEDQMRWSSCRGCAGHLDMAAGYRQIKTDR